MRKRLAVAAIAVFISASIPAPFAFAQSRFTSPMSADHVAQRTGGPLHITASIPIPLPSNDFIVGAEAPNGAVFASRQSTTSAQPSVVWVVDGDSPAGVAEHVGGGVSALAADATYLYVANYRSVTAYSRATGNEVRRWKLAPFSTANTSDADLVALSAYRGVVQVEIPHGNEERVYRFSASSTQPPRLVAQGPSVVFGTQGSVIYERSDHHMVRLSANGAIGVGPKLDDKPTALGGGVQYLDSVAGGLVWVDEPAGQGLDATYTTYEQSSLNLVAGPTPGTLGETIVDTAAGALALSGNEDGLFGCPATPPTVVAKTCVFRLSPDAKLSDATGVGIAVLLLGPNPVVITSRAGADHFYVDRLSP